MAQRGATLGQGLIMAVVTLGLIALICLTLNACYPVQITHDQIVQEAQSIWGNMTIEQRNEATYQWKLFNGLTNWTLEEFLVQEYGPQPAPRMPP